MIGATASCPAVEAENIKNIVTQPRYGKDFWHSIGHTKVVGAFRAATRPWGRGRGHFVTAGGGNVLAGYWELAAPPLAAPAPWVATLGIYNDAGGEARLTAYIGATCNVGAVVLARAIATERREQGRFDLDLQVAAMMREVERLFEPAMLRLTAMNDAPVKREDADHIIMKATRKGLVPWSRAGAFDKAIRKGMTAAGVAAAGGRVITRSPLAVQMPNQMKLFQLIEFYYKSKEEV